MGRSYRDHHWYDEYQEDTVEDRKRKSNIQKQRRKKAQERDQAFDSPEDDEQ